MSAYGNFGKHPDILVRQERPLNAGPRPEHLRRGFLTANEHFFVRNHGDVPQVDREPFRLTLGGLVRKPMKISLDELQRLPKVSVKATLQCAGNRREEMMAVRPIPNELGWGNEAVSTADWKGVPLREILAAVEPLPAAKHVAFSGLDEAERHGDRFNFGGSIPLDKALSSEVLLAYEMNGEPLPAVHGAPLRVVVPGYIGARSVKWLSTITLQEEPSDNYFQAVAYRLFPQNVDHTNVDWDTGLMLGPFNVNSLILSPVEGETLPAGPVTVRGMAYGGEREIARAEVSADGGRTWIVAELGSERARWAWRLWEAKLELPAGDHEIVCRAWDTAAQTQPEHPAQVWNFKGYMNNSWHRVRVNLTP
ncbi:MAG TPA: sulfite oxidase [Thermoanaerobaculia bacterium]|jgi:sulfite oxidase|nr:sulfite oxidase [Thermoanaerobaculia bacterium]